MSNGIVQTGTILDKIINHKREEVAAAEQKMSLVKMRTEAYQALVPPFDFIEALVMEDSYVALIAEVKQASPSKGILIDPFDAEELAVDYMEHGAMAISVLTDEHFFKGSLQRLKTLRALVDVPLLRKDFIISPYQIYEARAAFADAILLIVAALDDALLKDLHELAYHLDMAALVEVHDEAEMERALKLEAPLIGINNRDLKDFTVDLETTTRLGALAPSDVVLVGESGIRTAEDVTALGKVDAILVGETLVTAENRNAKIKELSRVPRNITYGIQK